MNIFFIIEFIIKFGKGHCDGYYKHCSPYNDKINFIIFSIILILQ